MLFFTWLLSEECDLWKIKPDYKLNPGMVMMPDELLKASS